MIVNRMFSSRLFAMIAIFVLIFNMLPQAVFAAAHDPNDNEHDYQLRFWEDEKPDIGFYINASARYILETVPEPAMGTTSGEWSVMDLLRSMYTGYDYINYIPENYYEDYITRIEDYVTLKNGNLDRNKSTEWSRLILALTALGYDITDVAGYDFIEKLTESHRFSYRQGINGPIWEIIAMNTGKYEFYDDPSNDDVNTYGKMIDYILDKEVVQTDGTVGGWALFGKNPDPDITGMALQALAFYYGNEALYNETGAETSYEEFAKSVERAVFILSEIQQDNGGFYALQNVNLESIVQVIVALTALGIDPLAENIELEHIQENIDFITEGAVQDGVWTNNMIDALLSFWAQGSGSSPEVGGFKHVTTGYDGGGGSGTGVNGMATDQALYGLIAYDRFIKGENALYDMTDMMNGEYKNLKATVNNVAFEYNGTVINEEYSPYGIVDIPEGEEVVGKEFTGWNTELDGTGTMYEPGDKLVMPDHEITLYAQYSNIEYTINYETNGGIFKVDTIPETYTIGDSDILLPTGEWIEREGFTFMGWYENEDFDGEQVLTIFSGSYGNKTFYAKWADNSEVARLVEEKIASLPPIEEITLDDKDAVEEARTAFDKLTAEQQELVSNVDVLVEAEAKIRELEANLGPEVIISTTLKDNQVTKTDRLTFDLWALDSDGNKINASNVTVTNNGQPVSINWDDNEKTSYTLQLELGENKVEILVDYQGNVYSEQYTVTREVAEDGDVIGTFTFSVEAFTIGLGYLVEPVEVEIIKGKRASEQLLALLDEYGYGYDYTGSIDRSFYLSYILDDTNSIYKTTPKIPDVLKEMLQGNYDENSYFDGELGEFDFNSLSGWMYAVNNIFPNVGFTDYYLKDDDVLRVQYTIALGSDIGGGMAGNFFDNVNKDALTKKVAEINSSDNKNEILALNDMREAYDNAIQVLQTVDATQLSIDEALNWITSIEQQEAADNEAAKNVQVIIDALPNIANLTIGHKTIVEQARAAYNNLTEKQQSLVTNISKLESLEAKLSEIEKDAQDSSAAQTVINKISALPHVADLKLDHKKAVEQARAAYNNLTEKQQSLVTNISKLESLEAKLSEIEKDAQDTSAAQTVINKISALPHVADLKLDHKKAVEQARAAYNNLTEKQQSLVTNISKLESLEAKLSEIEKDAQDTSAAQTVINKISALPHVADLKLDHKKAVEQARTAYNNLTEKQQALVTNINKLESLEAKLVKLQSPIEEEEFSAMITADEIRKIMEKNPEGVIVIESEQVQVEIPVTILPTDQNVTLYMSEQSHIDAIGPVYDFLLKKEDGSFITEFGDKSITIKFTIDPTKVSNWEDVVVYYIDENGEKSGAAIKPSHYNKETGEIWVQVTHFSTYGVFEDPSSTVEERPVTNPVDNDSNKNTNDRNENNNTNEVENSNKTNEVEKNEETLANKSGKSLPDTAINIYNILTAGFTLLIIGGVLLVFTSRRNRMQ